MEIKNFFKKAKWDNIIISILTLAIGILCVVMPNRAGDVLCIVFGVFLIAMGVALFTRYFVVGEIFGQHLIALSIVAIVMGTFCLVYPESLKDILTVLFGLFIVIDSVSSIADSIYCARAKIKGWVVLFVLSIATAVLGVVVMFATFDAVMIFAGISLIVDSIESLVLTIIFSRKIKQAKKQIFDDNEIIIK